MAMAMNHKPQTHIIRTSTTKDTMTSRNIRSMASSRKSMGNSIRGMVMGMAVTMTNRKSGV